MKKWMAITMAAVMGNRLWVGNCGLHRQWNLCGGYGDRWGERCRWSGREQL